MYGILYCLIDEEDLPLNVMDYGLFNAKLRGELSILVDSYFACTRHSRMQSLVSCINIVYS